MRSKARAHREERTFSAAETTALDIRPRCKKTDAQRAAAARRQGVGKQGGCVGGTRRSRGARRGALVESASLSTTIIEIDRHTFLQPKVPCAVSTSNTRLSHTRAACVPTACEVWTAHLAAAARMVSIRTATTDDLLAIQNANLHCLPENYQLKYYMCVAPPTAGAMAGLALILHPAAHLATAFLLRPPHITLQVPHPLLARADICGRGRRRAHRRLRAREDGGRRPECVCAPCALFCSCLFSRLF